MKRSQIYMLVGAILLGGLFIWPLWNITLEAPQYPDPIGMDIHINKFEDANANDIQNINIMNHYVGMKDIPETIPEFSIFPYVAMGMIALGIMFAFIGRRSLYLTWFVVMIVLGSIAMYDFYLWEYDYGHDLKENAAIKFTDEKGEPMAYQPPLIGSKMILNFRAISLPRLGAYGMFLGMGLSLLAFFKAKNENQDKHEDQSINSGFKSESIAALLLSAYMLAGCEIGPQPISYGEDACQFCKMTIVDNQHAAQIVTETGKAYKYDAIECMINDVQNWDRPEIVHYLVSDYSDPGTLINATEASFLIAESIPSPMGEYLSAFESKAKRNQVKEEVSGGGKGLTWSEIVKELESR